MTPDQITMFIEAIVEQSGVNETRLTVQIFNTTKSTDFVVQIAPATGDDTRSVDVAKILDAATTNNQSILASTGILLPAKGSSKSETQRPEFIAGITIGGVVLASLLALLAYMWYRASKNRTKEVAAVEL